MRIPIRLLRAQADDLPGARPRLSARELEREDHIIASATALMARHGRPGLTFYGFATAIRLSPATVRKHFTDLDALLAEILYRHLITITTAIGQAPKLPPTASIGQRRAARRAAYIAVTRGPFNAPTQAHQLLIRERHVLPPDLAEPIEALRDQIGDMLAGDNAEAALALLDTSLPAARIEAMLALTPHKTVHPAPIPRPAPPIAPPSPPKPSPLKPAPLKPAPAARAGPS